MLGSRLTKRKPSKSNNQRQVKHRWRDYETPAGTRPVAKFLKDLPDDEAAIIVAAMKDVGEHGNSVARHLDGEIWEVRADGDRAIYRVLFANVGSKGRILLALDAFSKKTQKTPPAKIALAKKRLRDWLKRCERK